MSQEQLSLPETPDNLSVPPNANGPRLEDPELDAVWQAQRASKLPTVPSDDLDSAQKNANARAAEAAHQARTNDQLLDQGA